MNAAELKERVFRRLDEDPTAPVYYTAAETLEAINKGLRLFALLTLCVERTANFTVTAATSWHPILSQLPDCIKIFIVRRGATRVQSTTFHEQDCGSETWQSTAGDVEEYLTEGVNLIAFTPQPAAGGTVSITYAACPATLALDADVPEIPEEYHPSLIDYACFWLRIKEGGPELKNELDGLQRFFDDALKLAAYVTARCLSQLYDSSPVFDIKHREQVRKIRMELQKEKMPKAA